MTQNRRSSDNIRSIEDFTNFSTSDTSEKTTAVEILLHTDFETSNDFSDFSVDELNGVVNRWNKIERKDILFLEFKKSSKEKNIHFMLKFYISRSYSYKITWYYILETIGNKRRSTPHYWEIKYTKIKGWKRRILETVQSSNDVILNEFQSFINESILQEITILKPSQNIESLKTWVKAKIHSFLKI